MKNTKKFVPTEESKNQLIIVIDPVPETFPPHQEESNSKKKKHKKKERKLRKNFTGSL